MITISKIKSGGRALEYYAESDDYYREGGAAPAFFAGKAAPALGLEGQMDADSAERFAALLNGQVNGEPIGQKGHRHTPGWDITFSAPKSVSVAALVGGDDRLVAAHDRAVVAALAYLEQQGVYTRQRTKPDKRARSAEDEQRSPGGGYVWQKAGMAAAIFRHTTSRSLDPQLHSHAVIANVALLGDGTLRSLDSRELYHLQRAAGAIYMHELARGAREAGYTLEHTVRRGHAAVELAEVPAALREAFSQRSAAIEASLAARGLTRATASAEAKQAATLATRAAKDLPDRAALAEAWRETAATAGYTRALPVAAAPVTAEQRAQAADAALAAAIEHLGEREMRFTREQLATEMLVFGAGHAGREDFAAAVQRAEARSALIACAAPARLVGGSRGDAEGYTTAAGLALERAMIAQATTLAQRSDRPAILEDPAAIRAAIAAREAAGQPFLDQQVRAATALLRSRAQLLSLDGRAGTAKTSSVLATVATAARARGWTVEAYAPTGAAAQELGRALEAPGKTTAALLAREVRAGKAPTLWIVDEAGMVGTRDLHALLQRAQQAGAKLLLVGDTKQIGSVTAGVAFDQVRAVLTADQIQATGLTGASILRQRDADLLGAVRAAAVGQVGKALQGVSVTEVGKRHQAVQKIATDYLAARAAGQDTLIVVLTRDDRTAINAEIAKRLARRGQITDAAPTAVLVSAQWTNAQKRSVAHYQAGQVLSWRADYAERNTAHAAGRPAKAGTRREDAAAQGPRAGEQTTVRAVGRDVLTLQRADGSSFVLDSAALRRVAERFDVAQVKDLSVGLGAQLVAKAPLTAQVAPTDAEAKGAAAAKDQSGAAPEPVRIATGTRMAVEARDAAALTVRTEQGQRLQLALTQPQALDLGYAMTADQAQGRTVDRAIGYLRSNTPAAARNRFYVAISRARDSAAVYTNDAEKLQAALEAQSGVKTQALGQDTRTVSLRETVQQAAAQRTPATMRAPAAQLDVSATLTRERGQHASL